MIQPLSDMNTLNSSALVETVSVNYGDFNENFLTCTTCLCMYDGQDRCPKLLHCSHTVCRSCLESIVNTASLADGRAFRCPICRQTIAVPQGGVSALPPSFLVNQLLDLMAQQRREIVPKCPTHLSQELLFCETCDVIFCMLCQGGDHGGNHNVIPFSIAIKRMSEILLYKATQCTQTLDEAHQNVSAEMELLEESTQEVIEQINSSFDEVEKLLSSRKEKLLNSVYLLHKEKRQNLQEQLHLIGTEKSRVETDCQGAECETEVRHITKKIVDVNERLGAAHTLAEPRDNAFMRYISSDALANMEQFVASFGRVKVSTTFPPLCRLEPEGDGEASVHLESHVVLTTVDFHGNDRLSGGDPVSGTVTGSDGEPVTAELADKGDGTYRLLFTPRAPGVHALTVRVFGRPVRGSPFEINASPHINPVSSVGGRGCGHLEFEQPTNITRDPVTGRVYILDTGNCRIKVLGADGSFHGHFLDVRNGSGGPGLGQGPMEGRGCTGITWTARNTLITVNWRTRLVSEMSGDDGRIIKMVTSPELVEPTAVAACPTSSSGEVVIVDNGARALIVFDSAGQYVRKLPYDSLIVESKIPSSCGKENRRMTCESVMSSGSGGRAAGGRRLRQGVGGLKKRRKDTEEYGSELTLSSASLCADTAPPPAGALTYVSGVALIPVSVSPFVPSGSDYDYEIVIACDSGLRVVSADGTRVSEVACGVTTGDDADAGKMGRRRKGGGGGGGKYGGLAVDSEGTILASKTEKGRSTVEVFRVKDHQEGGPADGEDPIFTHFSIDSFSEKLKRPTGLVPVENHRVIACDLGSDCVKTYRYK